MNVLRAITGSVGPVIRRAAVPAVLAVSAVVAVAIPVLVVLSLAQAAGGRSNAVAVWRAHHEACHQIPEEVYHRDRFRAIKGRVSDNDGQPIAGAVVRCVKLESLVELARGGAPAPSNWAIPIEVETKTDDRGRYEFPHLAVGGRTLFYSAPAGRDLAPAVKDLVVVQDGLGAQLDVTLAKPAKLTVRLRAPVKEWARLYLVPQRWWPSLETATMPPGWLAAGFRHLGGPFRKGLIAMAGPDESSPMRIIGRYDLDRSAEVELSGNDMTVLRYDLPEAAGIEPWRFEPSTEERLFYAAMSPVPLFWREAVMGWPSWLPVPSILRRLDPDAAKPQMDAGSLAISTGGAGRRVGPQMTQMDADTDRKSRFRPVPSAEGLRSPVARAGTASSGSRGSPSSHLRPSASSADQSGRIPHSDPTTGVARGFAPHPFLPVLVESHTAGPRLAWTSDASEFEVDGLPAGSYRVRRIDLFGRVTFATGVSVRSDRTAGPDEHVRLWSKVDLDEPDSRQVLGFVKWESELPVVKAAVFMQCSYNFRKYVRRVETDEQGFFRFVDVPGNEPYFVFALPPDDTNAMRSSEYFGVGFLQREVWRELTLHPHRVTGTVPPFPLAGAGTMPIRRATEGLRNEHTGSAGSGGLTLQLVRVEGQSEPIMWTFRAEPSGRLTVSNVPHGRYRVQVMQGDGKPAVRSLPFDVGDGRSETTVEWSSP